jgi:thioesterase domain-containing protein
MLDWANFATRGNLAPLAAHRRDEILRVAAESTVLYRAGRLAATVLLIRPDKDAEGLPSAPLDRWHGLETGGLEEHIVIGSPYDMLSEPAVASVAKILDHRIVACLRAAEPLRARTH